MILKPVKQCQAFGNSLKPKKCLFTFLGLLLLLPSSFVLGQIFPAQGGSITDYDGQYRVDSFPIEVNGLPDKINADFGLAKVCFNISHKRASDLRVELVNPSGASLWLTNRNGGTTGQDYVNTCFRSNGFSGYIHRAEWPNESGEYIPDGRLNFVNDNSNPNGTWWLLIRDLRANIEGQLHFATLHFETNPTPDWDIVPCDIDHPMACSCPQENNQTCELLPDLVLLEAFTRFQVKEYAWNDPYYPGQLRFAASIANIGDGPLETRGAGLWYCGDQKVDDLTTCQDGSAPRQILYQRIYSLDKGGLLWEDKPAGTNYYDSQPGHDHFHVDDWVEFRLLNWDKNQGNASRELVSKGRKVSFCLFDSGICNNADSLCIWRDTVFGEDNLANYGMGNYTNCDANLQGISVGGYDTYGLLYEGQYLKLPKGLKSGTYLLEIEIDPLHQFYEKDRSNNVLRLPIEIYKQE